MEMFIIPILLIIAQIIILVLKRHGNIVVRKRKWLLWIPGIIGLAWLIADLIIIIAIALILP